ncbi:MAG: hypothetical protein LBP41_02340 [Holosporaceae bacterium]|nr:hypothetical protein [Holosporaceae bacterium]
MKNCAPSAVDHDPICDHCFDMVQSIMKSELFRPRYSHKGYTGRGRPAARNRRLLYYCIPFSKKYMNGWNEYMIS